MLIKAFDDSEEDIMNVTSMVLQSHLSDGWQGWWT